MKRHEERHPVTLENRGQKLFGIFHKALIDKPAPAVMIFHGLAGNKSGRFRVYVSLAEELTRMGIHVFRLDFRGNGDSEGLFSEMTLHGQLEDALMGLSWLEKQPNVDPASIGFMGRSFGGAVSVLATEKFPHLKSLVLWSPVYSGDQWREQWEFVASHAATEEQAERLRTINGQIAGHPFYEQLFSMNVGEKLQKLNQVPLLHIHGDKDELVNLSHQVDYKKIRATAEAPSKFILLPGADHDFSEVKQMQHAIDETAHWFSITLKDRT